VLDRAMVEEADALVRERPVVRVGPGIAVLLLGRLVLAAS
jgi:ElaB/YqjD/DUF883 family membrane-anchored ribosome-binding protein